MINSSFNMDLTQNQDISLSFRVDYPRHRTDEVGMFLCHGYSRKSLLYGSYILVR